MPTAAIAIETVNFDELQKAFDDAPVLAGRYVKQALFRFSRRVARRTKQDYLRGAPGIKGGPWARLKDKNIRGFTVGTDLASLKAISKASRIVRTHIEGAVIQPKRAGYLFLSRKTGRRGQGTIFARVSSVTIPARIPFEQIWRGELPQAEKDVAAAAHRAAQQALEQHMKSLGTIAQRLIHA